MATNTTGRIVVFLEVGFTLTYRDGEPPPTNARPGVAHAIAVWCDALLLPPSSCAPSISFYPPCYACSDPALTAPDMASTDPMSDPSCLLGLSVALYLASTGTLVNTAGTFDYLHVPSSDTTDPNGAPTPLYGWYLPLPPLLLPLMRHASEPLMRPLCSTQVH